MTGICNSEKLMEFARRGLEPDTALRVHLKACRGCRGYFESQKQLTRQLGVVRAIAADSRSSVYSRDDLMRQLAAKHRPPVSHRWLWSFAAAAVLVLSLALVHMPRQVRIAPQATRAAGSETPAYLDDALADSQDEGFIAVPYVPPLATGELVRIVHTELYPAALASLGVNVDPTLTSGVSADLLMGEDGFPRAVRVSTESF